MKSTCLFFALVAFTVSCLAIPQLINYQGYLTALDGSPLDTTVAMTFVMYIGGEGGEPTWNETHPAVTVSNGLFNVLLGSVTPLPVNTFASDLWLGTEVGADGVMEPLAHVVSVPQAYCVGTVNGASGGTIIGKLNVGNGNSNEGSFAFVAGQYNRARGDYSSIAGGGGGTVADSNSARGIASSIGGGLKNDAVGNYSSVGGGWDNNSSGLSATVAGGFQNTASGDEATVGGGILNQATQPNAFVGGGQQNTVSGTSGSLLGGVENSVNSSGGALVGGLRNSCTGQTAFIGGGEDNQTNALNAVVCGGDSNRASGTYATIAGGYHNVANSQYSAVGGGSNNIVNNDWGTVAGGDSNRAGGVWSTVAGGGENNSLATGGFIGGGGDNLVFGGGDYGALGGGYSNYLNGSYGFIGGGTYNSITLSANRAVISGGNHNFASGDHATVGGGESDSSTGTGSTVGGGASNTASGVLATVGGGIGNSAAGYSATVPGGSNCHANGDYSFAAGHNASAVSNGVFAWADDNPLTFAPGLVNSFNVRASGGVRLYTNATSSIGAILAAGQSAWAPISDSTKKERHGKVDTKTVLEKVSAIPIETWSYKDDPTQITHMGPMAQDFWNAFHLGESDTTISTLDPDGVALAAIQELAKENTRLQTSNSELNERIARLETLVQSVQAYQQQAENTSNLSRP